MALENNIIQDKLIETFGLEVKDFHQEHDIFAFEVSPNAIHEVIKFLKEDPTLRFNFLTDVCRIHYPDYTEDRQLAVVYHLHNWFDNKRIRIKSFINGKNPVIDSVSDLFLSSNWQERETYDFYGIKFRNHPQLKRILNMDEMESYPMRKEFPLEDGGRTDKDDRFFGRTVHNC